jgi:hypothetical protein
MNTRCQTAKTRLAFCLDLLHPFLTGAELGETHICGDILPFHLDGHIAMDILRPTADDVGHHAGPFIQFHECDHIGYVILKVRVIGPVINDIGIYLSPPLCRCPSGLLGMAIRAKKRGRPADTTAFSAFLKPKLVLPAAIPEGLCVGV